MEKHKKTQLIKIVKCRPSSGERWYNCPNSAIVARLDQWDPSIHAATGTGVMAIIEKAVKARNYDASSLKQHVGKTEKIDGLDVTYTDEDMEAAAECLEEIQYLDEFEEATIECEVKLDTIIDVSSDKLPINGRADFVITKDDQYVIVDYKHGVGYVVSALNNYQMLLYLKMLIDTRGPKDSYSLRIIQPRARHDVTKQWDLTHEQFVEAWKHMEAAFARINLAAEYFVRCRSLGMAHYELGKHCKWCTIEASCPAVVDKAITAALTGAPTERDSSDMIEWMLSAESSVSNAFLKAKEVGEKRLLEGQKVNGYKLVYVSGNRSIRKDFDKEELKALKKLGLASTVLKVAGVGEFDKAAKKGVDLSKYILPGKQSIKMVPENAPGDPVGMSELFDDEGKVGETK